MNFQTIFKDWKRKFCDVSSYEEQVEKSKKEIEYLNISINIKTEIISTLRQELNDLREKHKELQKNLLDKDLSSIDLWCQKQGYRIQEFAYRDKIFIKDTAIPCDLRELITPNSYVVRQARKSLKTYPDNVYENYLEVMRFVHRTVTWTDDGRQDNYFYPNYTLTVGKADCEDMAFAQASINPDLGVAFGFWQRGANDRIGHAFAVGVIDSDLIVFDSVPNQTHKYIHKQDNKYYIHYIVTNNAVYVLDGSVDFGEILYD